MSAIRIVLALFVAAAGLVVAPAPAWASGTVTVSVVGHGTVTGPNISCSGPNNSGECSQFYPDVRVEQECDPDPRVPCVPVYESPVVDLTADAGSNGYAFRGWTGCDSVTGRVCTMTVESERAPVARYDDVTAPQVSAPWVSGDVRGTITLATTATDNSGTVSRVVFRVRGAVVATDSSAPYSASFDTSTVADGPATIAATAYDAVGHASTASSDVTIDNTAPDTSVTSGPADGSFLKDRDVTFGLGATEPGVTFNCRLYRSGVEVPAFGLCSTGSTYSSAGLVDGDYVFEARATDGAGNVDATPVTRTFTVDNVAPDTSVTHDLGQTSFTRTGNVLFTLSATEPGSTFACRIALADADAPSFGDCSGGTTHAVTDLPEGQYVFEGFAVDRAGNPDQTPARRFITVDKTAPETSVTTGPADGAFLNVGDVSFGWSATEQSGFWCRLYSQDTEDAAWEACLTGTYSTTGLSDGAYVFEVAAQDTAGNRDPSPAKRTFHVDTLAPNTMIDKHPRVVVKTAKRRALATFEFSADESTQRLQCKLDADTWKDCASPTSYRVGKGKHTFKVRATDLAGNRDGTPAAWTWTVRRR